MLDEIPLWKLHRWMAYYFLEPFGDEWRQTGTIASMAISPHLKEGKSVAPDDFIPKREPTEEEWEVRQRAMNQRLIAAFLAIGAKPVPRHG